jgi:hypothetical protein
MRKRSSPGSFVAFDRERKVVACHAGAVVGHHDAPLSAAFGQNVDAGRAGIERILHQFLDHAGRPLDHLAGGDAIDDAFGQLADGHECGLIRNRWILPRSANSSESQGSENHAPV